MGLITLQTPVIGNPNSTEAPKVDSNFIALSSLLNGGVDTNNLSSTAAIANSQLASNVAAARRLIFFNIGTIQGGTTYSVGGQDFMIPPLGGVVASGVASGIPVPMFPSDAGINGNPADFNNVSGMTAKARIRGTVSTNSVSAGVGVTVWLYQVTGLSGSGNQMSYSFSQVAGTACQTVASSAGAIVSVESAEFTVPTSTTFATIGVNLSAGSGTTAASSFMTITAGLYMYHV